ncbi:MAG: DUF418 domain-containing protein [Pseudonocardia sp.]
MTAALNPPVDPGATPIGARNLAPDLARGGMLLLIALANVHVYVYGQPTGVRGYPGDLSAVDRTVAAVQLVLVDGRAYPLFGLLFGYGIVQLARRRTAVGMPTQTVQGLIRRRGWWMLAIGFLHAAGLWAGDIVGLYGLIAVLLVGLFVTGTDRALLVATGISLLFAGLLGLVIGLTPPEQAASLASMTVVDPAGAALTRVFEWLVLTVTFGLGVFGAVALGVWAARRTFLDEPQRHRRLLVRVAVVGLAVAVLGGLPLALIAGGVWPAPSGLVLAAGFLHALSGYAGGIGYAALFGLLAVRLAGRGGVGGKPCRSLSRSAAAGRAPPARWWPPGGPRAW